MRARVASVLMAALVPLAVLAQESAAIPVGRVVAAFDATDPDDPAWRSVSATAVKLETAFPGHPSISGTADTQRVEVRALRSAKGLSIRLEWNDAVADIERTSHRFGDGVAIQFSRDGKTSTTPYMGGAGRTVNIWYWNAAKKTAENLWADGFGTLRRLPTQDVRAHGRHTDGKWRVVFFRAWRSPEPKAVRLSPSGNGQPLAFAVWNGANDERDGFKAVTLNWQSLRWAK